jgi:hypothetical protein
MPHDATVTSTPRAAMPAAASNPSKPPPMTTHLWLAKVHHPAYLPDRVKAITPARSCLAANRERVGPRAKTSWWGRTSPASVVTGVFHDQCFVQNSQNAFYFVQFVTIRHRG